MATKGQWDTSHWALTGILQMKLHVQGDMGWTSFEVREAQSKLDYEQRLRNMEESKLVGSVQVFVQEKH